MNTIKRSPRLARMIRAADGLNRRMRERMSLMYTEHAIERARRTSALRLAAFRAPPAESNRDREGGSTP